MRRATRPRRLFMGVTTIGALLATAAYAGESVARLIEAGVPQNCAKYAARVSASEGNFKTRSKQFDCLGAFQFCPGTFELYYKGTEEGFLADPQAQVIAWTKYEKTQWALAVKYNLQSIVGKQVCSDKKCVTVDHSAILMACQFGCGKLGKLYNFVKGADCDARNVKDGNGVSVCKYLVLGAGHDVSCFTGIASSPSPSSDEAKPSIPGSTTPSTNCVAAAPANGDSRLEVAVGRYAFRFDAVTAPSAIRGILDILDNRK